MKILVVDDKKKHRDAAVEQLKDHDVVVAIHFDDAVPLINGKFDVVLTDLLMPKGSRETMGPNGMALIFDEMAFGFAISFIAAYRGVHMIAVLSDANHHDHPMSYALDYLASPFQLGDCKLVFSNCWLIKWGDEYVKDWKRALDELQRL